MNELDLITCIVQRGKAEKVIDAALLAGAPGATYYYGRGTGVRQKLGVLSKLIVPEKEIILIVTKKNQTDAVFDAVIKAGKLVHCCIMSRKAPSVVFVSASENWIIPS